MSDLYLNFGKQVPLLTLLFQFLCLAHFFCYFKVAKFIPEVETTIRLPAYERHFLTFMILYLDILLISVLDMALDAPRWLDNSTLRNLFELRMAKYESSFSNS